MEAVVTMSWLSCRNYSGNLRCLNHLQFSTGHFLRVSFGDEHGDRLFAGRQESLVPFYQRMMYVLQTGGPEEYGGAARVHLGLCSMINVSITVVQVCRVSSACISTYQCRLKDPQSCHEVRATTARAACGRRSLYAQHWYIPIMPTCQCHLTMFVTKHLVILLQECW